ncbi:MAG: MOSC domain-containing protein [Streptosporangiales bacterium]|nr:MOSC domain-containing protein [Streptosporangiales bacterium]
MTQSDPRILSVNAGRAVPTAHSDVGVTGIDKRPVDGPVLVTAPGPGKGASGLAGDSICDYRHHGGDDQAVYAYAREDLDLWQAELGRPLRDGAFGENLTTAGLDLTGAVIGERWHVGDTLLEVCHVRIPCRTFAGWLDERRWVRRFTERGLSGAYLRVVRPGTVSAGAPVEVVTRPGHGVTVAVVFRALTTEPELLPRLLEAGALAATARDRALRRAHADDTGTRGDR